MSCVHVGDVNKKKNVNNIKGDYIEHIGDVNIKG